MRLTSSLPFFSPYMSIKYIFSYISSFPAPITIIIQGIKFVVIQILQGSFLCSFFYNYDEKLKDRIVRDERRNIKNDKYGSP